MKDKKGQKSLLTVCSSHLRPSTLFFFDLFSSSCSSSDILHYITTCSQMQSWRGFCLPSVELPLLLLPLLASSTFFHIAANQAAKFEIQRQVVLCLFSPLFSIPPLSLPLSPFLHPSQLPSSSSCHSYQVYYMQLHVPSLSPVSLTCLFPLFNPHPLRSQLHAQKQNKKIKHY